MKESLRTFVEKATSRSISGYDAVVREERYFCAVLYHCMLSDRDGMQRFLQLCGVKSTEEARRKVFVEYAMARDLWHCLESNEAKRRFLLDHANLPKDMEDISDPKTFNERLVAGTPSPGHIQSPARWKLDKVEGISKEARMLKWAFNVKPDIVIELDKNEAICIEAKVESSEAVYAGKVPQTCVQHFLMKEVLGYETHMVFLSPKHEKKSCQELKIRSVTWSEAYGCFSGVDSQVLGEAQSRIAYLVGGKGKTGGCR